MGSFLPLRYKHPITIYIPPHGELRGGAWVVLDPKINPENMEMYADKESRGGILEPPAACDLLWKEKQIYEMMHRNDSVRKSSPWSKLRMCFACKRSPRLLSLDCPIFFRYIS